jgi:signal transduction histidine kinase
MKPKSLKEKIFTKPEVWIEIITWTVMILVVVFIRLLPNSMVGNEEVYLLIGGIIGFALIYYLIIYRYFNRTQRLWIKDISDIIIISVLIILAKDYGTYFFALYFLPIAAATLVLGTINSLLIAVVACLFVVLDIFLNAQGYYPGQSQLTAGIFQIAFILLITIFCRFLALQVREEKRAREKAEALVKAKELSEKREREFMTMTSHQLMTPLSIIRGFSSILASDKKVTGKEKDYACEINTNTEKMVNLIKKLMNISKMRSDKDHENFDIKKTSLEPVIENVIACLKSTAEKKGITIKYEKSTEKLPEVYIDTAKIEDVLTNIIDNAIKYSKYGFIEITTRLLNKKIVVNIKDTGLGISKEDQTKIFTPFFRSKKTFGEEGTGLGLYISKIIVERHGGEMWLNSKLGKGSVLSFSLPIKND